MHETQNDEIAGGGGCGRACLKLVRRYAADRQAAASHRLADRSDQRRGCPSFMLVANARRTFILQLRAAREVDEAKRAVCPVSRDGQEGRLAGRVLYQCVGGRLIDLLKVNAT